MAIEKVQFDELRKSPVGQRILELNRLAEAKIGKTSVGEDILSKLKPVGKFALNVLDALEIPFYALGGILAGVGIKKGIKRKIRISDALLGDKYLSDSIQQKGFLKTSLRVAEWIARFGIDVITDPLTYVFPASLGKTMKVFDSAGNAVRINKDGMMLLEDLTKARLAKVGLEGAEPELIRSAQEMAKVDLANLVSGRKKILSQFEKHRWGEKAPKREVPEIPTEALKKILPKLGIEPTSKNIKMAIEGGIDKIKAGRALKLASPSLKWEVDLLKWSDVAPVVQSASRKFRRFLEADPTGIGKTIVSAGDEIINNIKRSSRELFNIGVEKGVPKEQLKTLQLTLKRADWNFSQDIREKLLPMIDANFNGFTPNRLVELGKTWARYDKLIRENKIITARKLLKSLPENEQKLLKFIQDTYEHIAKIEMDWGLVDYTMKNYFPLIFKNKKLARQISQGLSKGDKFSTVFRFGKSRTITNPLDLPEEILTRLKPEWDIRNQFFARISAHYQAVQRQRLILSISKDQRFSATRYGLFGVNSKIPEELWGSVRQRLKRLNLEEYKVKLNIENPTFKEVLKMNDELTKTRSSLIKGGKKLKELKDLNKAISHIRNFMRNGELSDVFIKTRIDDAGKVIEEFKDFRELVGEIRLTNPKLASEMLELEGSPLVPLKDYIIGLKKGKNISPEIAKEIERIKSGDVLVPKWVADELVRFQEPKFLKGSLGEWFRGIRKVQAWFKFMVTMPFPAFHARNLFSDTLNLSMEMGFMAAHPKYYKRANAIMSGEVDKIVSDIGEVLTREQLLKEMRDLNVNAGAVAFIETEESFVKKWLTEHPTAGKILPPVKKVAKKGIELAERRENLWRRGGYIFLRSRGFDPETAISKLNRMMVDYTAATPFERDVIATLFPFYKWYKNNTILHLEKVLTETGRYSGQLHAWRSVNDFFGRKRTPPGEEMFLPLYIKNQPYIWLASKNDKNYFLYNFDLPIEQAFQFFKEPLRTPLLLLSPIIKTPLEWGTQKNFFKDKDIKDDFSGGQFRHFPKPLKDFMEYKVVKKRDSRGREYEVETVDPVKKYFVNALLQVGGAARILSQSNQNDISAIAGLFSLLKGDKITYEQKVNLLHFISGVMIYEQNPTADRARTERRLLDEYGSYLERIGIVKNFKQFYKDKNVLTE